MTTCPREPNPGDRITASWMRELVRYVRGLTPIAGPGVKVERKPDGTVFKAAAAHDFRPSSPSVPWSFACTVANAGEANETRTGGWSNCILQLGYNKWLVSPDVLAALTSEATGVSYWHTVGTINGTGTNADGDYVVEVNLVNETAAIMLKTSATHTYPIDHGANIVYVDIGHVENARQTHRIPNHPVIYKYA